MLGFRPKYQRCPVRRVDESAQKGDVGSLDRIHLKNNRDIECHIMGSCASRYADRVDDQLMLIFTHETPQIFGVFTCVKGFLPNPAFEVLEREQVRSGVLPEHGQPQSRGFFR